MGHLSVTQPPKMMADAVLNQSPPITTQWYTVLDTTRNVRIYSFVALIVSTVGATSIEVRLTIDGIIYLFTFLNPVTATPYEAYLDEYLAEDLQVLVAVTYGRLQAFLIEGRTVKIEARRTGGTVSQLWVRARYGKY